MPRNVISSPPSAKPELQRYCDLARAEIRQRIESLGWTWTRLAREVETNGIASSATILHWGSGRNSQIGVAIYLAAIEILDRASARQRKPVRIGAPR